MRLVRPPLLDVAIAAALLVWAAMEALLLEGAGSPAERLAWAVGFTTPLLWRRSAPVSVAVVLAVVVAARVLVAEGGPNEEGAMPFPAVLLATFSVAVYARTLVLAIAAGAVVYAAILSAIILEHFTGDPEPADGAILSFFVFAAWGAGYFVRRRTIGGIEHARAAVAAERDRIARELHDIIGHSMSIISLQAGAAERLLRRDPDKAETHLRAVEKTAHEALVEMRRLMGVLREDEASYAPQPGVGSLDTLVGEARAAGLDVEVVRDGAPVPLPPGVDLAVYRIVQEALTNARKHAGTVHAEVRLRYEGEVVDLEVRNETGDATAASGGGQGLIGMRERARLFGGTFDSGWEESGGFRVHARLPVGEGT